ncbi:MAG: hypothetical protein A3H96_19100 [Acidobacteria bacterium RIFCSPLOWO2_02_FULL_67_36]|nr:MAG: hypothetical protein A3H96_19100 [Acidobacteria bacterium RIFCSPLOWO2_02_FULL_67_36]OFW25230.1 MAG: hypothetical protein A3G21_19625 [Acidobacteria bacterium RIFCSPLOWO2_12_FULL_66_21]
MKTALTFLALSLFASSATAQPVKLHLFTKPDDGGFVTAESKGRQEILKDVTKELLKKAKKDIVLANDAALTVEILGSTSVDISTAETRTSILGREDHVQATLRFGDYTEQLDVSSSVVGGGILGDRRIEAETKLAWRIQAWVKDNAAKLK